MKPAFEVSTFFSYLGNRFLIGGAVATIWLTLASMSIGIVVGLIIALMRMSKNPLINGPAKFYIWVWRGTPLLVQLLMIYVGLPQIGIRLGPVQSALTGLGLNSGAYLSEIIRSGILAVDEGQFLAARALGMNYRTMMKVVVLPQAARVIIPPLGNRINGGLKTTSMTSVISMSELLRRSRMLMEHRFAVLEVFTVAAIYYLIMTTVWGQIQNRIEARLARGYGSSTSNG
jgi:polar amino acid transport system permease protein